LRMAARRLTMSLFVSAAAARPAVAWGKTGHRVLAAIAWQHMTPRARAAAIALLEHAPTNSGIAELRPNGPDADERWFVEVATWPDLVRFGPHAMYNRPSWHFIDRRWRTDNGKVIDLPKLGASPTNIVTRLVALEQELRDPATPVEQRALALVWIIHLVG